MLVPARRRDNYGMGLNAGTYAGSSQDKDDAKVIAARRHRQPGPDQAAHPGLRRRPEELPQKVARVAADFTVESGQKMRPTPAGRVEDRRPVEPRRRPGRGRAAAIKQAGRDEFLHRRGGLANAMHAIKADNSV